jgi:hypothetical protein
MLDFDEVAKFALRRAQGFSIRKDGLLWQVTLLMWGERASQCPNRSKPEAQLKGMALL